MSAEIRLIYTATRGLVSPMREGTEQTLVINASQNDPPMPYVDGRQQFSRRGRRKATTVHGRWYQGTIKVPYFAGVWRPYHREYFESTAEEEVHQLVHPDYPGWDDDLSTLTIFRPLNSGRLGRIDLDDDYSSTIEWRELG